MTETQSLQNLLDFGIWDYTSTVDYGVFEVHHLEDF
jgi:hypothetical protein